MVAPSTNDLHIADLFVPEFKELLAEKKFRDAKNLLKTVSMVDLADVWEKFSPGEQTLLFRLMPSREASSLFQEIEPEQQQQLLSTLGNRELEGLLEGFDPEEAARLFHELPPKTVKSLYALLEHDQRARVDRIYQFPDNTVGSWMRIQNTELRPHMTTAQAIAQIQTVSRLRKGGGPDGYYVTDASGKVVGSVALRELIAAPPKMKLSEYMRSVRAIQLDPNRDQEDLVHLFKRHKLSMAPVVDDEHRLLGYVQAEDIIELLEEEVSEDIAKMAGTEAGEFESESIWSKATIRFPWLIATCIGQLMVAFVIHRFNFVLSQIIALASFLPFIVAMGGNVGSQSSMILVRSLATRDFDFSDRWRILWKETSTGFLLGIVYGALIGGTALLVYGAQFGSAFPVVIGLATVISMTVATITGVVGPLTLVRFGVDPATATGPLITTATDLIGTAMYFLLAMLMLL